MSEMKSNTWFKIDFILPDYSHTMHEMPFATEEDAYKWAQEKYPNAEMILVSKKG